jgi:hypothetical protein
MVIMMKEKFLKRLSINKKAEATLKSIIYWGSLTFVLIYKN